MLFSFKSKNKEILEQQGTDSTVDSTELFPDEVVDDQSSQDIKTKLSFHPGMNISPEDKYYFQFLNNELAPLKENQLSISGVDLKSDENGMTVTAIVRNSLSKSIQFQQTPILLMDKDGKVIGRKDFDLSQLGEIPAESSRPWFFHFSKHDLNVQDWPEKGWKLAFELKRAHSLDLEESWTQTLSNQDREKLEKLVQSIEPPKSGEVNFMGISANQSENGNLHVTLLIRNGSEKNITLQQLPLIVEDAIGDVIAKGGFKLDPLEIKANTSKPWTFIFPSELVLKENIDLSKWKAYPPKQ